MVQEAACRGYLALGIESISRSQPKPGSVQHPLFCLFPAHPARNTTKHGHMRGLSSVQHNLQVADRCASFKRSLNGFKD